MKPQSLYTLIGLCIYILVISELGQRAYHWGMCQMVISGIPECLPSALSHQVKQGNGMSVSLVYGTTTSTQTTSSQTVYFERGY